MKKKTLKKRILSFLLAVVLVVPSALVPHAHAVESVDGTPAIVMESKSAIAGNQIQMNVDIITLLALKC